MFRSKRLAPIMALAMASVPCRAEYLVQTHRLAQRNSFRQENSGPWEEKTSSSKEDFRDLVGLAVGGVKESFSGKSLAYWGVGACLVLATHSYDERIRTFFQSNRPLRWTSGVGDLTGNLVNMGIPAVAVYSVGRLSENREMADLGRLMFAANLVEWPLSLGLICAVRRERPPGGGLHIFEGRHTSFPSGHVVGSFATAAVLNEFYGPTIGVPAYLLAGFVGLSRIEDDKHYAADVVGGAALGTVTALALTRVARTRWAAVSATPAIREKGGGLTLVCQF